MTVRFGVVGLGNIGRYHVENLVRNVENAQVVAVCDISEDAARSVASMYKIPRWYTDPAKMREDPEIDAVLLAVPNFLQYQNILTFAECGKHIFVEKPMAIKVEEAKEIVELVKKKGIIFQVGYNRRFHKAYAKAKEVVDSGALGRITQAASHTRDPGPPGGWEKDPKLSGGIFVGTCAHDFDLLRWLVGSEVRCVFAIGKFLVFDDLRKLGYHDNVAVLLEFKNDVLGIVNASRNCAYGYDVRTEIFGTEGAIRIGKEISTDIYILNKNGVSHDYPYWFKEKFGDSYIAELQHFVECVEKGKTPMVTAEDALRVLEIAIAARTSVEKGTPVQI